jgi:glycosyltransferase involved in cell wall biosynthesis
MATYTDVVCLFATKSSQVKHGNLRLEKTQRGRLEEYVYYYPERSFADSLWSQVYYGQVIDRFITRIVSERGAPSLVVVNIAWRACIWALYLQRKYGWPFSIVENSTEYYPEAPNFIGRKIGLRRKIMRKAFRRASVFIPVASALSKAVTNLFGPTPFQVVPNCVDTSLFYPAQRPGSADQASICRLLHISTMGHQKNIDGIIRVLAALKHENLRFEVVMIGPRTPEMDHLLAQFPGLEGMLRFTGWIPYADVAGWMRQSDALFLFSRYENLPCVILEAFCCGLPVVATRVGGVAEVVNETNGILVNSNDEDALQRALRSIIEGSVHFKREQIAAESAQKFSYQAVGKAMMEALASPK